MDALRRISIERKEALEIDFWRDSPSEGPESDGLDNIVNKATDGRIFLDAVRRHQAHFSKAASVLELGGGQCWASCMVKRLFPSARVVGTDISPAAVASTRKWQHIYQVELDEIASCRSYDTPFADGSFDLIFAFSAAHHFVRHGSTLREISRLLVPGGVALYLYEPTCRQYLYRMALARVNAKRPEVPEDILRYRRLEQLASRFGLKLQTRFCASLANRGPLETVYYFGLQTLPMLQHLLPCTADIIIEKPPAPP
ncbi:MAG: methyltransferase [Rhodospirillales bacterium]|jgi:SAM-dependent methyltransferase|nr:methyltransferase [Rhodospirillales bacterium]